MFALIKQHDAEEIDAQLKSIKKKKILNQILTLRNEVGNTPILEAVARNKPNIVLTLLNYSTASIVNLQDWESGYTAVHKSLLNGDLEMALILLNLSVIDYEIKDREGFTFLELLHASMKLPKIPLRDEDPDISCNSLVALESDVMDYNLNFDIASASMSFWAWGSNNNFLLGSAAADARSVPEQVRLVEKCCDLSLADLLSQDPQIIQIAMSKYHVAILTDLALYTYGFGIGGRLGHDSEDTIMSPRIVSGVAGSVAFVALGHDHSIAITKDGRIFSWGSNKHSQLGIGPSLEKSLVPKEVILKKIRAVGATASKYHSAIYTNGGSIYSWGTNYGQLGYDKQVQSTPRKITSFTNEKIVQIASTSTSIAVLLAKHQIFVFCNNTTNRIIVPTGSSPQIGRRHLIKNLVPVSICGSSDSLGIVLSSGDVCVWRYQKNSNAIQPAKCVWYAARRNRKASTCAIGIDSALVVVTESGHVFTGKTKDTLHYKFSAVSNLEHVVLVAASSSGSYAAIRSDFRSPQILNIAPSLGSDLRDALSQNRTDFDCILLVDNNEKVFAHQVVLASRSPWLRKLWEEENGNALNDYENLAKVPINACKEAVELILEFLYTGTFKQPWPNYSYYSNMPKAIKNPALEKIQSDFKKLVKLFQLDELEIVQSYLTKPACKVGLSIKNLPSRFEYADVIIKLKDGSVSGHSVLLSTRCPFFAAVLKEDPWILEKKGDMVVVNLKHIATETFEVLLQWIVGDSSQIFDHVRKDSVGEWIEFLQAVQLVADELLLPTVSSLCGAWLARFVTINNVLPLLEHALTISAHSLKDACLDFVLRNIETFLKNGSLLYQSQDVVAAISAKLKQLQVEKYPLMYGPDGFYEQLRTKLTHDDKIQVNCGIQSEAVPQITADIETNFSQTSYSRSSSSFVSPLLRPLNMPRFSEGSSSFEDLYLDSWMEPTRRRSFQQRNHASSKPPSSFSLKSTEKSPKCEKSFALSSLKTSPSITKKYETRQDSAIHFLNSLEQADLLSSLVKPPAEPVRGFEMSSSRPILESPFVVASAQKRQASSLTAGEVDERLEIERKEAKSAAAPSSTITPSKWKVQSNNEKEFYSIMESPAIVSKSQLSARLVKQAPADKLSQKERKKQAREIKNPTPRTTPSNTNRWAIPIPAPKTDLADIQKSERFLQSSSKVKSPPLWKVSPVQTKMSLLSIQQEQQHNCKLVESMKRKTIKQIQQEEAAITEFEQFYKGMALPESGEWIEIELVQGSRFNV